MLLYAVISGSHRHIGCLFKDLPTLFNSIEDSLWFKLTAAQSKISNSSDHKRIRKFSSYPDVVRCMISADDGEYIVSFAIGKRFIAVWSIDGIKKNSQLAAFLAISERSTLLSS